MKRHKSLAGLGLAGVLLALALLLTVGNTFAAYTTRQGGAANAQVADFAVEITAPEGMLPSDAAAGPNEILYTLPGTEYEYEFLVTNYSQVTVQCTVTCEGQSMPSYSITPQSFQLEPGESQPITLLLAAAGPSALETVQDMALGITCEQVD